MIDARCLSYIDSLKDTAIELESLLVQNRALAPENSGTGEAKKAIVLHDYLLQKGFTNFFSFDAPDTRVPGGVRPNLCLVIPGKSHAHSVWFIAHLDVVPAPLWQDIPHEGTGDTNEAAAAVWQHDPWQLFVQGDKLYGRGAEDNGQGLTSAVIMALTLQHFNLVPDYDVKLLFCSDEEVGSAFGLDYMIKHCCPFKKDDIIIIPDGGDSKGECIEVAEKGILWLNIHTKGKQAHGSRPDTGSNAFTAASKLLVYISELSAVYNQTNDLFTPNISTFSPTLKLSGSTNYNTIPGDDIFGVDIRLLPCYTVEQVLQDIKQEASRIEKQCKVSIDIKCVQQSTSPQTKLSSPAVLLLCRALKATRNIKARTVGIGGGTVAASLRRAGYDNCVVWSTLLETAHSVNEYALLSNLLSDAKVMLACVVDTNT